MINTGTKHRKVVTIGIIVGIIISIIALTGMGIGIYCLIRQTTSTTSTSTNNQSAYYFLRSKFYAFHVTYSICKDQIYPIL
jgi:hypothetical protein